jgi:hypothetical protein
MTKPVPGAKRGRPPKPKPPKLSRGKGRPKMPLRQHRDRYALACFDALAWLINYRGKYYIAALKTGLEEVQRGVSPTADVPDLLRLTENLRAMSQLARQARRSGMAQGRQRGHLHHHPRGRCREGMAAAQSSG